jgi:hypothetical protein
MRLNARRGLRVREAGDCFAGGVGEGLDLRDLGVEVLEGVARV